MPALRVAVIGAAGYGGIELVRLLLEHPFFELVTVSSDSDVGVPIAEAYPAFLDRTALSFSAHDEALALSLVLAREGGLDAAFLAVPHTAAMRMAPALLKAGVNVFDLSADFRLKDPKTYEQWYGVAHSAPSLLPRAVYGLPELYRSHLAQAAAANNPKKAVLSGMPATTLTPVSTLVACPGCYPTASALAAAPALAAGLVTAAPVVVNAISGASGAGRAAKATTHFCSVDSNVNAYGVTTHRHTPEIAQIFSSEAGREVSVVFTPHLAPLKRGLLATVTLSVQVGVDAEVLETVYRTAYEDESFVRLLPFGTMPHTASVLGSNCAHVGIAFDKNSNMLIASCAIDNLGKGAAAQAIQCANVVFGFKETVGLIAIPPVV